VSAEGLHKVTQGAGGSRTSWRVARAPRRYEVPSGRWPSNLLLLDDGAAAALDAQSGDSASSDSGGASRFFYRVRDALDAADPVCYTAKASRAEREAGLEK